MKKNKTGKKNKSSNNTETNSKLEKISKYEEILEDKNESDNEEISKDKLIKSIAKIVRFNMEHLGLDT